MFVDPWSPLVEGSEDSHVPYCQTSLVIEIHELVLACHDYDSLPLG